MASHSIRDESPFGLLRFSRSIALRHLFSGRCPSRCEGEFAYFDRAIDLCCRAGFRTIRKRGDTNSLKLCIWTAAHDGRVQFVFGMDSMPNLVKLADNLPKSAWKVLHRRQRTSAKQRARQANTKGQGVVDKEYMNQRLEKEFVAVFDFLGQQAGNSLPMRA